MCFRNTLAYLDIPVSADGQLLSQLDTAENEWLSAHSEGCREFQGLLTPPSKNQKDNKKQKNHKNPEETHIIRYWITRPTPETQAALLRLAKKYHYHTFTGSQ